MAEGSGDESEEKNLDPTTKRLADAHKKGQVAKSQELTSWAMMMGASVVLYFISPLVSKWMASKFSYLFAASYAIPVTTADIGQFSASLIAWVLLILTIPFIILVIAGLGGNLIQHRFLFTGEQAKPQLSRLSIFKGFKRLFSIESLLNFVKGLFKITLVTAVIATVVWPDRDLLEQLVDVPIAQMTDVIHKEVSLILFSSLIAFSAIAFADYAYQRHRWWEKLKMSLKELKDEMKDTDGNPEIKRRIREIRAGRVQQQINTAVPLASVVITNPTHYSVALRYEEGMGAPIVVAKGMDLIALRIRKIARENNVPLIENRPLARALYATVEVNEEIPEQHYAAVAKILGYLMRLGTSKRKTA